MKALLPQSDPWQADHEGMLPLHHAAQYSHDALSVLLSSALISEGGQQRYCQEGGVAWVDVADFEGRTPLMWAATTGNATCMRLLLDRGADMGLSCKSGRMSLHMACLAGHSAAACMLLAAGALLGASVDKAGRTPLHLAAQKGHESLIHLLLQQQQDGPAEMLSQQDWYSGATPLHLAAEAGRSGAVAALLQGGSNPAVPDKYVHMYG